ATARETEIAERQKAIELVEAQKEAQRQAIGITVAAQAEKAAAIDRAEALKIGAQGEAEAEKLRVQASAARYAVDAEGQRAVNEAANTMSAANVEMQIKMALMKALPDIIRESVKPMENIDGIKILQVNGLNGSSHDGGGVHLNGGSSGSGNLAEEVVNNALRYRAQAPILDSLLAEIGITGGDLQALAQGAILPKSKPSSDGDGPKFKK
ncbi:flotillin family protein, partial [bacterium]